MSKYELNGRQIKNVVQLALTLSKHEGVGLKQRHIDETLEMTTEFLTSFHFYCYFVNIKKVTDSVQIMSASSYFRSFVIFECNRSQEYATNIID